MYGIDLNQPIEYCYSSMRYFKPNEHHIDRIGQENVLLLVYDGILRFTEDEICYEIHPGQYHIQKRGSQQYGPIASDSPRYLYIHFQCQWGDSPHCLPIEGTFTCEKLFPLMEIMDLYAHSDTSLTERVSTFFRILCVLHQQNKPTGQVNQIADYICKNLQYNLSLDQLSQRFGYSKNYIINLFKREYRTTPINYLICKRIERAEWLLESTNDTLEHIAVSCGFSDYSHFYKCFKKTHANTPTQWRHEKKKHPFP